MSDAAISSHLRERGKSDVRAVYPEIATAFGLAMTTIGNLPAGQAGAADGVFSPGLGG